MGYTTEFQGEFDITPTLKDEDRIFLTKLSETRRMKRDLGPEYGVEGEFYVDGGGDFGQAREPNIINYNTPPSTQPGLWCQWVPSEEGDCLAWNGAEKFYCYVEWLEYIVKWLAPRGYRLDGQVLWRGEDFGDVGRITVRDNVVVARSIGT